MPKLERSQWYDLSRDMNWNLKYVTEEEVFPDSAFAEPWHTCCSLVELGRALQDQLP